MTSFLRLLRCPFCGGSLSVSRADPNADVPEYGVLDCHCGRYPIVAGIPIIKKGVIGAAGQQAHDVIGLIEAGQHREALLAVLLPPPPITVAKAPASVQALRGWQEHAEAILTDPENQTTVCDLVDFYYRQTELWESTSVNYFLFRFSHSRYPIALSLASLIHQPDKPVLDLACGTGHITRSLISRAKNQPVIGSDRNFFFLYVAKNWLASQGRYVCSAADATLPFQDGAFSTVFCSDAFHVFPNKLACIEELKRLTQADGTIILVALPTLADSHPSTLPPEGYKALVADMPHRLIPSSDLLSRYLSKQGPALTNQTDVGHLMGDPWMSVVASHRQATFRDYGPYEDWPHAEGNLRLDPLYREERRDEVGNVYLRRVFPSTWYEQENAEYRFKDYLPETVCVNDALLRDLGQGKRTPEMEPLIGQCVITGLPDRYAPANFSHREEGIFQPVETIGGTFYIETIKIPNLLEALIPFGHAFILVDESQWRVDKVIVGRRAIPFLERDGQYWGRPSDDANAISELERLRKSGATFIVFGSPAIWWLEYYAEFGSYLYSKFRCVLQHDRLVAFDLRP